MNYKCIFGVLLSFIAAVSEAQSDMRLWYDKPSSVWEEALPLGNGRLGAMVFGGPSIDEIQINEETIWGGSPHNNVNPKAKEYLGEIRRLIFEGRNAEAQALCQKAISSPNANGMPYQTVGSLMFDFPNITEYDAYYRELDLTTAVAKTTFKANGANYTREVFTSFVDDVVVVRLTASKKKALSFKMYYKTPYEHNVKMSIEKGNTLRFDGRANDHETIEGKVRFSTLSKLAKHDGRMTTQGDTAIVVEGASSAIIYISVGTNFVNYKDVSGDEYAVAQKSLSAVNTNYQKSLVAHTLAYSKYFNRVTLDLGRNAQADKPTNIRVEEFASTFDPQLAALYFQFGRYLLICSSQPGGQAANLQGIWNYQLYAPWDGKYTTDINVEMNYWPAEATNLSELHEPFLRLVKECAEQGKATAEMYGCRGWTLHHNTDIWRSTGSVDGAAWGIWPTCNAWFCQHLWDRYLFSGDKNYLAEVYPLMKSACQFYFDFLVTDPESGKLVASPSYSPENTPTVDGRRDFIVVAGATMDNQMIYDLMRNTAEAAVVMNEDVAFIDSLRNIGDRLVPMQVGRWGQLQEWMKDWDSPQDKHRHISHLWGLYPGRQITYNTPLLLEACKKRLEGRGDQSTGWSMGWKVCCWARLLDGNHAYKLISDQLQPARDKVGQRGGTYPNLFDAHPPFQIDGNFGCAAGISEMMVQSHAGIVDILPALPDVWKEGTVKGLRCRGGFEIEELTWSEGVVKTLKIRSTIGGVLRLRSAVELQKGDVKLSPLTEVEKAKNVNPLLSTQEILRPLISPQAPINTTGYKDKYIYDIPTSVGELIELSR
jgi:alpha-L-fucosidase 2